MVDATGENHGSFRLHVSCEKLFYGWTMNAFNHLGWVNVGSRHPLGFITGTALVQP